MGARSAGAKVTKIRVCDLKIAPCRECSGCARAGVCVIKDDMAKLARHLLKADKIVVAAPIFFYGLPAQLKAVVDRSQALWERRRLSSSPLRTPVGVFVLLAGATRGRRLFEGSLLTLQYFAQSFNGCLSGKLLVCGVDKAGDISFRSDLIDAAFEAGREFVRPRR